MNFDNDENLDYQLNKIAANIIKEKRLAKGYSLEEVVKRLNNVITRQSLFRYESNEARMKNTIFKQICLALNENPNDIWNEINNRLINNLIFDDAEPIGIDSEIVKIPILGVIKAGIPIEAQENIIGYTDIPKDWTKGGKNFFGLKISGNSMTPNYLDGDIVIFESTTEFNNGDDCAIMVNGDDCTFKKVAKTDEGILLQPYNIGEYELKFYSREDIIELPVKVIGVAREYRRKI